MANEAVKRYDESSGDGGVIQDYTVADGTAISKGVLLKLTDPRTAIITSAAGDVCAGIAARDKVASDGRTQLAVYKKGYFDMVASGAIIIGAAVMSAGAPANTVKQVTNFTTTSGAAIIGYAEETASDGETVMIRLNL